MYESLGTPCPNWLLIACSSQEFLYYEPRENDKHLSATLNNILQRPRRNTPKLVKQTYSVVSPGQPGHREKSSLTCSQFVSLPEDRPLGIQRKWHISEITPLSPF